MRRPPERRVRTLGLAFALGLASVLAFAPIGAFPLIFLTFGGLYRLIESSTEVARPVLAGALTGGVFGFGLFVGGVSWVYVSLSNFGGMPAPLAGLSTLLFCVFLALYPSLACAIHVRFAPRTTWQRSLFFAALWTLGEWLRGWLLTGFPWLAVGYSQTPPSPLAGFAPILGVYGVSWLTVWLGTLLGTLSRPRTLGAPRAAKLTPLLMIAGLLASGTALREISWTQPHGQPISVALLQGNIPQEIKWQPERFTDSLRVYYRLARDNPAQLTVLPETAIPAFLHQLPAGYLDELRALALRENGELVLGIATGNATVYTNSAFAIGASGTQRYHKRHLVPFGEFVPPGFRWFMSLAQIPMSDFTPGVVQQAPLRVGDLKVAPNICYEDAFGEEIIHALPEADLLVNLSNVAWFGDSLAPAQHLQIAKMRSLETGRMSLRATNTGMTAIIGADGRLVAALPPYTQAALRGEVRGYEGATPFVRWGNTPIVVFSMLLILFAIRRKARV